MPQGFLMAPIVFMLFTLSIFKLFTKDQKKPRLAFGRYLNNKLLKTGSKIKKNSVAKAKVTFLEIKQ